jgi:hypothetical protein
MNTAINSAAAEATILPAQMLAGTWGRFKRYAGVGLLVAVGYMDPGNWATDIEAGSRYGYPNFSVNAEESTSRDTQSADEMQLASFDSNNRNGLAVKRAIT